MSIRLQKALASAGLGSRRACERLIAQGRVTVDGKVAVLGTVVDPGTQAICVDGKPLEFEAKEYWILNKPRGVLSAAVDDRRRRTVVDLIPSHTRLYPVGRLDADSTGVLLLTNDGELTARLLHPRHHVPKEYLVTVQGKVTRQEQALLEGGILLDDGLTAPAQVKLLRLHRAGGQLVSTLSITLYEGRKRQIRRMMAAVGHPVISLHRCRFGSLSDAGLAPGEARQLSSAEVESLRKAAGVDPQTSSSRLSEP